VDSLANVNEPGASPAELHALIKDLAPRWAQLLNAKRRRATFRLPSSLALGAHAVSARGGPCKVAFSAFGIGARRGWP
jgi:hypothetical protein